MKGRPVAVVPTCKIVTMLGWPDSLTHRVLFAQESVEIFRVKVGGQHLDGDRPVQQRLSAAIHDAKAALSDFGDIFEARVAQFRGNVREQIPLRRMLIDVGHQWSLSHSLSTADNSSPNFVGWRRMAEHSQGLACVCDWLVHLHFRGHSEPSRSGDRSGNVGAAHCADVRQPRRNRANLRSARRTARRRD